MKSILIAIFLFAIILYGLNDLGQAWRQRRRRHFNTGERSSKTAELPVTDDPRS